LWKRFDFNLRLLGGASLLLFPPRPEVDAQVVRGEGRVRVDLLELARPQGVERHLLAFLLELTLFKVFFFITDNGVK
jgi:hypothetical protein